MVILASESSLRGKVFAKGCFAPKLHWENIEDKFAPIVIEPLFLAPWSFGHLILYPTKFCSNSTIAPQIHRDIISKAKITTQKYKKKSCIRETMTLWTDADSSTNTTVGWTKNKQNPKKNSIVLPLCVLKQFSISM